MKNNKRAFKRGDTLLGTNISEKTGTFEDDSPFPQVGQVNFQEGNYVSFWEGRFHSLMVLREKTHFYVCIH